MLALTVDQLVDLLRTNHKGDDLLVTTWWSAGDLVDDSPVSWDEVAEQFAHDGDVVVERGNFVLDDVVTSFKEEIANLAS
jgi:hypothetical protein